MKFLVVCLALVSLANISAAIECYKCGGYDQASQVTNCKDQFNPSGISKEQCLGSCAKYKGEIDGVQLVWRTCVGKVNDDCVDQEYGGKNYNVCFCNSELCNAATTSRISVVSLLAMLGVGLWLAVRQ